MTNDPVTGTASGSATYKVKPESGCWEGEIGVKSDGARDLKVTAKKLVDNTKMKFGCTYNPFADICNISTEVDFAVDKVHTTVTQHAITLGHWYLRTQNRDGSYSRCCSMRPRLARSERLLQPEVECFLYLQRTRSVRNRRE